MKQDLFGEEKRKESYVIKQGGADYPDPFA